MRSHMSFYIHIIKILAEPYFLDRGISGKISHPNLHLRFGDPKRSKLRAQIGSKNSLIVNLE